MLTNVYVDAFNLYYGCLKGTPYRWLDLDAFCRQLLPRDRIHRIRLAAGTRASAPAQPVPAGADRRQRGDPEAARLVTG
jgi:hypothetical protein